MSDILWAATIVAAGLALVALSIALQTQSITMLVIELVRQGRVKAGRSPRNWATTRWSSPSHWPPSCEPW